MNMAVEIRRRTRGASILFPLEPMLDESIRGYLARVADWNCLDSRTDLLRFAGLTYVRRDLSDRISAEIAAVSDVLGIREGALRRIINPTVASDPEIVDYFGLPFQRRRFEIKARRIAPSSLSVSPHHRARWKVRLLPFCPESWEHLIDTCPSPTCAKPLRWAECLQIDRCEHCDFDLKLAETASVPPDLRDTLSFVSDIIHPAPEVRSRAIAKLPAPLSDVAAQDVFEVLCVVTRSVTPEHIKLTTSAQFDTTYLALAAQMLLDYPRTLDRLAEAGRDEKDHRIVPLFAKLRRRAKQKAGIQKALVLSMVDRAETAHHGPTRLAKMREEEGEWTFHRAAVWLGISLTDFNDVVAAGLASPSPRKSRVRDIRWIKPDEVHPLSIGLRQRMSPEEFVQSYQIPLAGMEQLVGLGLLKPCTEPIVRLLHPGFQLDRVSVLGLVDRLADALAPPLPDSIALEDAFQGIGGGEKPWAAIIQAALDGLIPGGLGIEPDERLRFERLRMPRQFAWELLAGRYPDLLTIPSRSKLLDPPSDFSRIEAERYLNCFPRDLAWLLSEGHLSSYTNGQIIRRAKVEKLARKYISDREISWRWRVSPALRGALADKGLGPVLGPFRLRLAVEKHFRGLFGYGFQPWEPFDRL